MNKIFNFKSKLLEKIQLSESIYKLYYEVPPELNFKPGQFIGIRVIPTHTRAYSIVSIENNRLELLIDIRPGGIASKYFDATQVGDEAQILGPYGIYGIKGEIKNKVFIATSTGIAPFIPMIKSLDLDQHNIHFLFGAKVKAHDIAYDYFTEYIGPNFKFHRCLTREEPTDEYSVKGRVTNVLPDLINSKTIDPLNTEFYICGANEMIADVVEILKSYGADKIYFEKYG